MKRTPSSRIPRVHTPPIRHGFERWMRERYPSCSLEFAAGSAKYSDRDVERSWEAWQASRAAAVRRGHLRTRAA